MYKVSILLTRRGDDRLANYVISCEPSPDWHVIDQIKDMMSDIYEDEQGVDISSEEEEEEEEKKQPPKKRRRMQNPDPPESDTEESASTDTSPSTSSSDS